MHGEPAAEGNALIDAPFLARAVSVGRADAEELATLLGDVLGPKHVAAIAVPVKEGHVAPNRVLRPGAHRGWGEPPVRWLVANSGARRGWGGAQISAKPTATMQAFAVRLRAGSGPPTPKATR